MTLKKLIYVVDDDEDDRFLIIGAIRDVDSEVVFVEAENGKELITWLNFEKKVGNGSLSQCVILVDMNMPIMNGIEVTLLLKSDPELSWIPTLMITTSSNNAINEQAEIVGIDEIFIKPTSYDEYKSIAYKIMSRFPI